MDELVFGGDSVDIPRGTYAAKLVSITTMHSTKNDSDFRVWDFELESGSRVGGSSSLSMNAKSKGGKWTVALLGRIPTKGEKVNPIGQPCLVQVDEDDNGWPKVVNVSPPMVAPVSVAPVAPQSVVAGETAAVEPTELP